MNQDFGSFSRAVSSVSAAHYVWCSTCACVLPGEGRLSTSNSDMETPSLVTKPPVVPPAPAGKEVQFGVNEVRLSARQWLATFVILALVALLTPRVWKRIQHFDAGPDYRMPYELSKDYWLYEQRLDQVAKPGAIVVLGDSVVWGEYVLPNGTLSHFLNQQTDRKST